MIQARPTGAKYGTVLVLSGRLQGRVQIRPGAGAGHVRIHRERRGLQRRAGEPWHVRRPFDASPLGRAAFGFCVTIAAATSRTFRFECEDRSTRWARRALSGQRPLTHDDARPPGRSWFASRAPCVAPRPPPEQRPVPVVGESASGSTDTSSSVMLPLPPKHAAGRCRDFLGMPWSQITPWVGRSGEPAELRRGPFQPAVPHDSPLASWLIRTRSRPSDLPLGGVAAGAWDGTGDAPRRTYVPLGGGQARWVGLPRSTLSTDVLEDAIVYGQVGNSTRPWPASAQSSFQPMS